eukprot:1527549-Pleurochrysis_carterae.AAC.1
MGTSAAFPADEPEETGYMSARFGVVATSCSEAEAECCCHRCLCDSSCSLLRSSSCCTACSRA